MTLFGHLGIDFAQAQAALLVYILKYDLGNIWNQKVYFDERESVESRVLIFDDLRENFWKAYILTLWTGFTTSIINVIRYHLAYEPILIDHMQA